ncbi:hypothetical protein [Novosphingobium percolationis]|uniref:hypothetical protein n=1 Tax=Novosphingobium percolationis TaxID=2871811 RepID=UPI001CD46C3A|nr:hypothetical protein [Novosphingobium percolationis]
MPKSARLLLLAPLALGLALGGCGRKDADKGAKAAGGEVLPGTVSDAMIDLDTSTATPPMQAARPSSAAKADKAPAADASAAADEAAPAADAAPAPAAPPAG